MVKLNPHFKRLKREYIFPIIDQKLADLKEGGPDVQVLNFGVGDVALPLAPSIAKAIAQASRKWRRKKECEAMGHITAIFFCARRLRSMSFPIWASVRMRSSFPMAPTAIP